MYSLVEIGILNAVTAAALGSVVLIISRLIRRPAIVHALWVLVLLKLVTPPLVEIPVGLRLERIASFTQATGPAEINVIRNESRRPEVAYAPVVDADVRQLDDVTKATSIDSAVCETVVGSPGCEAPIGPFGRLVRDQFAATNATVEQTPPGIVTTFASFIQLRRSLAAAMPILLWIWGTGTVVWFAVQGCRIFFFARFASTAQLASSEIQQQAERLAATIGVRRAPKVWVLHATMSPILWAFGSRARVIFPVNLLSQIDEDSRATLLTHELAHFRRRDHWVRLLEFVVTGLFWWHPVVWIARREIEVSEEQCCDAWVVEQFPEQPRRYAEAILDTIDFLSEDQPRVAPVASGLGQAPFLRERICKIMSGVAPKSMSAATRFSVSVAAAVLLPLGPELFEGVVWRADAALKRLDWNEPVDVPSLTHTEARRDRITGRATGAIAEDTAASEEPQTYGRIDDLLAVPGPDISTWAVVNSQDGRFQAIAKTDGGLMVRDTLERRLVDLSEYRVSSMAFVPHRDLLAVGSADATVYLFDCASGVPLAKFSGHQVAISSVAVSLDGRFVASGSRDGVVKLWDLDDESEVPSRVPDRASAISCVRFSPDGRLLAVASGNWMTSGQGNVIVWDLRGGAIKVQLDATSPVGVVAFSANRLVAVEWNGRATNVDLETGATHALVPVSKDTVSAAAFAADAQHLLLAEAQGEAPAIRTAAWFERMDRDRDGMLAWKEFLGPRGTFRNLDADSNDFVTWQEARDMVQ